MQRYTNCYHPRNEGGIIFSSVCLCLFVCLSVSLSVNTITPELLEVSSRTFQGIVSWVTIKLDKKAQLTQGLRATASSFQDGRQPSSWILGEPQIAPFDPMTPKTLA